MTDYQLKKLQDKHNKRMMNRNINSRKGVSLVLSPKRSQSDNDYLDWKLESKNLINKRHNNKVRVFNNHI
jgi:hypothetical protein